VIAVAPAPDVPLMELGEALNLALHEEMRRDPRVYALSPGHRRLPPGRYDVLAGPLPVMQFTKDLPATVVIVPDQETRLDVRIDTGLC
jgi:hypothetical protein